MTSTHTPGRAPRLTLMERLDILSSCRACTLFLLHMTLTHLDLDSSSLQGSCRGPAAERASVVLDLGLELEERIGVIGCEGQPLAGGGKANWLAAGGGALSTVALQPCPGWRGREASPPAPAHDDDR
jgi:hypothetical protein